ncbi:hypothetical protein FC093_09240 [Ilyomonas limi]|uniref:Uncharacterized protein n=1 Tax=Ilyomonas limi TaxID=2575867 RepID=A0A4U3L171_9BACT|nr:hypothetical protein FC093_09240 [Ilyomonas limi]
MKARQRKFDYWFDVYNTDEYKKITSTFTTHDVDMIANFIFLKNNPFAYDIPLMIDEAKDSFNNK